MSIEMSYKMFFYNSSQCYLNLTSNKFSNNLKHKFINTIYEPWHHDLTESRRFVINRHK